MREAQGGVAARAPASVQCQTRTETSFFLGLSTRIHSRCAAAARESAARCLLTPHSPSRAVSTASTGGTNAVRYQGATQGNNAVISA